MKLHLSLCACLFICCLTLWGAGTAFAADTGAAPKTAKPTKEAAPQATKPAAKPAAKPATKAATKPAAKAGTKSTKPVKKDEGGIDADSPWSLRNHYTSSIDDSNLYYADDDADLALEFKDVGMVIVHTGFKITFGDGHSVTAADLGKGFSFREPFETSFGKGIKYALDFPEKNGVKVHHSINIHDGRPFVLVRLEIENTGTTPLEISGITPIVIGPGNLTHLGDALESSQRHIAFHGPFPTYDPKAPSLLSMVYDRAHKRTLAFGVLPEGAGTPTVNLDVSGAAKSAEVGSVYTPHIQVAPGQKFTGDPVWLCYRVPDPVLIDMYYSWARSTMPRSKEPEKSPDAWVTVEPSAGAEKLYAAAKEASAAGIKHVLVPTGWASKPGSLQGGQGYPKDMGKVVKELTSLSKVPGITVDPLCSEEGETEWSTRGETGPIWLNLSNPKGKEHAIARLKPIVSAGFAFFAVATSEIPDAALKQFNMTRSQAELLAYEVMAAAAKGAPVVAPSVAVLGTELGPWLEAAAASSRMREYGVVSGAVRVDGGSFTKIDDSLAAAMTLYGGPIEVSGETAKALATVFPRPRITGRPLDAAKNAPKAWQIHMVSPDNDLRGDAIALFPGSSPLNIADMERDAKTAVRVWRADNGEFLDASKPIAAADRFTLLGVTPESDRPTVLGAGPRIDLLNAELGAVTWNEGSGTLKGEFAGNNTKAATAYAFAPSGWSFKSGFAGKTKLSAPKGNSIVEIPVEAGGLTRFELVFSRK